MTTRALNGATVRTLREVLGITQRDLAARIGISPASLSNIERSVPGASGPLMPRRIADALGVTIDAITYPVSTTPVSTTA
jgi:transcriptional regulator with XRE-family HTH domain